MIRFNDAWLRLNPANEFGGGIYCGTGILRTDGQFEVGNNGSSLRVTTAGNVTVAGTLGSGAITATNLTVNQSAHNYLAIEGNDGSYEAMTRYKNGLANYWYTGLRTSAGIVGTTGYHIYSTANGNDVGGYSTAGVHHVRSGYAVGATTVIDASRNLTNIGTINAGTNLYLGSANKSRFSSDNNGSFGINYGTTGGTATNSLVIYNNTTASITLNRNGTISSGAITASSSINLTAGTLQLRNDVALDHDGTSLYIKAPGALFLYPGNTNRGNISTAGLLTLQGYAINGTTVIESNRNLSNVVTATVNTLHVRGDSETGYGVPGSMLGGLSLWGAGATTSQMMFKPIGSGSLGNHGFCTDYYNTYFVMDTTNRGWVFRNHTTATNVASISNTGGIAGVTVRASNAFQIGTTTVIDANRQIFAKTGTQVGEDGTYGGYGVIGFGGITNGYNRVFGNDGTADGLFLASASGRGVYIRVNGGSTDTFSFTAGGTFAVAGTAVLDQSRNLSNIGTISSGAITSSSDIIVGNRTGYPYAAPSSGALHFGSTLDGKAYSINAGALENIGGSYSKLHINWHTGIKIGAAYNYGGIRFYNNSLDGYTPTMLFSIGNTDQHVRVTNTLYAGAISSGAITSTGAITSADFFKATGGNLKFSAGGNHIFNVDLNGKIYPQTHNAVDLGFSGTLAFRTLYLTNSIYHGTSQILDSSRNLTNIATITATNVHSDGGNLIMGDQAYSASAAYVGMKTSLQSGASDYMIISGLSDGETYVSARDGSATTIRGGGNNSSNQITVLDGTTITATTSDFRVTGNVTAYASDKRLKTNIKTIENPIEKIKKIRGVEFDWLENIENFNPKYKHETGVIAQEIEEVIPDAVSPAPFNEEYKTVEKDKIVALLIEAIKEQQKQIDELKQEVTSLRSKI